MDFRNVAGLTIPAGSVNKISIGGVVVWVKSTGNKYKILKDGVEVAQVTMSEFVKAIQSGAAQEDWGIGAQIVVPYHDPWDNTDYELPFNFGTFTAYGEGKLGLQAHYAIPSTASKGIDYGVITTVSGSTKNFYSAWSESYIKQWLNSYNTEHELTAAKYVGKIGFLGCLPEDFVNVMNTTYHNSEGTAVASKIFLPGATNMYAKTDNNETPVDETVGDGEDTAWEYWINRINLAAPQGQANSAISERKIQSVDNHFSEVQITLPNRIYQSSAARPYNTLAAFNIYGGYDCSNMNTHYFLPACVIG